MSLEQQLAIINQSIRECDLQFAELEQEEAEVKQQLDKLREDAVHSQHSEESDLTKLKQLQRLVAEGSERMQKIQLGNVELDSELEKWRSKREQLAESDRKQQSEAVHFLMTESAQIRELALLNINLEQDQDEEVGQDATDAGKKGQGSKSVAVKTPVRKSQSEQPTGRRVGFTFRVAGSGDNSSVELSSG